MKRTVWKFGLIAGVVMSVLMTTQIAFIDRIGFDRGMILGYASIVAGFLMVYFGVRSYRDDILGGAIGFGRALGTGLLITLVASACYVITWEVVQSRVAPDFVEKYSAHMLEKAKASGASAQELAAQQEESRRFAELYRNPLMNAAMTFMEPLPVGVLITLVSAGLLRRARKEDDTLPTSGQAAAEVVA